MNRNSVINLLLLFSHITKYSVLLIVSIPSTIPRSLFVWTEQVWEQLGPLLLLLGLILFVFRLEFALRHLESLVCHHIQQLLLALQFVNLLTLLETLLEVGRLLLGLRDLGAHSLPVHGLLVSQTLAQVRPLESEICHLIIKIFTNKS